MASLIERWEVDQSPSMLGLTKDLFDEEFFNLGANTTVGGGQATETDTANAGTVVSGALVTGSQANETDVALAGSVSQITTVAGVQANETDEALAGSVVAGSTVAGAQAVEIDSALAGTVSAGALISGSQANETDTANAGSVSQGISILGNLAEETDVALAGSLISPLDAPMITALVIGTTTTQVSWSTVPGATAYVVRVDGGVPSGPVTPPHTLTGLTPGTSYLVEVRAQGGGQPNSSWGGIVFVTQLVPEDSEWGCVPFATLASVQNSGESNAPVGGCRIGCPETTVFALNRCGNVSIGELSSNASTVEWGRTMDDVSEALVHVDLPGDGTDEVCCDTVGGLRSWIHTIGIYRDGDLVWGPGPITNIVYKADSVTISVRDVAAWLDKRKIHGNYTFVNQPVLEIARQLITDALGVDDPCDLIGKLTVIQPAVPTLISADYVAGQKMGEILRELARTVLDYTVVGMSIILAEALEFGPFGLLTDNDFQVDIEVEERGLEAATQWEVQGSGVTGQAGGADPFYGLLEEVANEDDATSQVQVDTAASGRLAASNAAPLYINVPDGANLSPDAAVCVEQLVPGSLFNVQVLKLCRKVNRQMRLTAMKGVVNAEGEKIGITLSPIGTNFGDAAPTISPGSLQ